MRNSLDDVISDIMVIVRNSPDLPEYPKHQLCNIRVTLVARGAQFVPSGVLIGKPKLNYKGVFFYLIGFLLFFKLFTCIK